MQYMFHKLFVDFVYFVVMCMKMGVMKLTNIKAVSLRIVEKKNIISSSDPLIHPHIHMPTLEYISMLFFLF